MYTTCTHNMIFHVLHGKSCSQRANTEETTHNTTHNTSEMCVCLCVCVLEMHDMIIIHVGKS